MASASESTAFSAISHRPQQMLENVSYTSDYRREGYTNPVEEVEEVEKSGTSTPYRSGDTTRAPSRNPSIVFPNDLDSRFHEEKARRTHDNTSRTGCVAGGKHLDQFGRDEDAVQIPARPMTRLEFDIPLTFTKTIGREDNNQEVILLQFAPKDPENPFNWPVAKKRFLTYQLCAMTLMIGLATTAYSSGISSMCADFGVSTEIGQLGLFLFNSVCAIAPLFLAPFCELVGRKIIYVGAYACFIIMFIGLASGRNIATILVCRALLGLFGCVGTILVGGTFSDMHPPESRARSMALFSYVAILGTVGAPIYAGFIDETIGWRWIEGVQGLANLPLFALILFFFTETRGGVVLKKRAKLLRQKTGDERYISEMELEAGDLKGMLHASSVKAIKMLATEPVVFFFGLWIAFAWFLTFLFLSVITITFEEKRGWSHGIGGLPYISLCIGVTIGFAAHFLQIRKYEQMSKDPNRQVKPEDRLYGAMCGAVFLPIGLFVYSFTQYGYLPWIAPTIALAPIAIGIFFIFESCYSFTADCYGENSSSAIAGQGLMRNMLGGVSPLFASQFFHNVGSQYAGLILALIGTLLTAIPFIMFKWGPALRKRSKLAETVKSEDEEERRPSMQRRWSSYRGSI